jgi:hypothetical protein
MGTLIWLAVAVVVIAVIVLIAAWLMRDVSRTHREQELRYGQQVSPVASTSTGAHADGAHATVDLYPSATADAAARAAAAEDGPGAMEPAQEARPAPRTGSLRAARPRS